MFSLRKLSYRADFLFTRRASKFFLQSLLLLLFQLVPTILPASPPDPADLFLKAYQEFQNAEHLEQKKLPDKALAKYRYTASLLCQIQQTYANWQPLVVSYRLRKTQESIARLELSPPSSFNASAFPQGVNSRPPPVETPSLSITPPQGDSPSQPPLQTVSTAPAFQYEVRKLRWLLEQANQENQRMSILVAKAEAEKQSALIEVDKIKVSLVEAKSQNSDAQSAADIAHEQTERMTRLQKVYKDQLTSLQEKINTLDADNSVLTEENDRLFAKLNHAALYISESDKIRESLINDRLKFYKAEYAARRRLKQIHDNTQLVVQLQAKLNSTTQELLSSQDALNQGHTRISDLEKQLRDVSDTLAKFQSSNSEELLRHQEENELLRGIILREIKGQAQRDQALQSIDNELIRLRIHSPLLVEQLTILKQSAPQLSEKEKKLFKEPVLTISADSSSSSLNASIAVVKKKDAASSSPITQAPNLDTPEPTDEKSSGALTSEQKSLARLAEIAFRQGNFADCEVLYSQIVEKNPSNVSMLANLGAVQSQLGKYSAAEDVLRKALALNPTDPFTTTTLGILQLKCAQINDAIETLKNSIKLDSKNFSAHNYLGIAYGETGRLGEAEVELKKAIELNPNYATAHFNLAVLYSTQKSPNKELARKHYLLSTHLGAAPDAALERLIQ